MTGRLRYLLAAAFVALFFLIPAADREHIAFLQTRAWLTSDAGPFAQAAQGDKLPVLATEVLTPSDPVHGVSAAERRQRWQASFERVAREWARSNQKTFDPGLAPMRLEVRIGDRGHHSKFVAVGTAPISAPAVHYPDRWSLLPAFLAIVCAILTARVIPSLLLGCLAGSWLYTADVDGGITHLVWDTIAGDVLGDTFNIEIMGFVVFLFMAVGVMSRSGGLQGMVELIRKFANGPISSQLCSYAIGLLIFFDDYSNCIITGTTMRPLTDRNRVSREKLAYIVDATAAPIAGISIFSTWVAYEVSMFAPQLPEVTKPSGVPYEQKEGFLVFIETLPLRFYCVFTLIMVFLTIVLRREFGPMRAAEARAALDGKPYADDARPLVSAGFEKLEPGPGTRCLARNALIPIGLLVSLTLTLILVFGHVRARAAGDPLDGPVFDTIKVYLQHTESQKALFWASLVALLAAAVLAVGHRILTPAAVVVNAYRSIKSLGFAVVILVLAWTIGEICQDVGTSQFLTAAFGDRFQPWLLPSVLFLISSLVAFSTGTSYGTMAILLPNVVVLSHTVGSDPESIGGSAMMMLTIGAVLEGSIFGDHCSPISDTTVLSSVATGSDHLHHVRTQAPYAVFIMVVAMLAGYLPLAVFGPGYWYVSWLAGIAAIAGWLYLVGRSPEDRRGREHGRGDGHQHGDGDAAYLTGSSGSFTGGSTSPDQV